MSLVYLNGAFLPLQEACVPVMDRGFIFGDAIYEVIPVYSGRPFRLEQHLLRLENSLAAVRIEVPFPRVRWRSLIGRIIGENGGGDQSVYVQLSRGVSERDHVPVSPLKPSVFIMSKPLKACGSPEPVSAIVCPDFRWGRCDIKTTSLIANVLLRYQAMDAGAWEAILVRDRWVTEGAASNVFVVDDGLIKTPPRSPHILPGITRDLLVEMLGANVIPCAETPVSEAELWQAQEIWLTSSTREIVPVVRLNETPVGKEVPGPLWVKVNAMYQQAKQTFVFEDR
ncbi:MAG: D-amino acid aminotransferase [Gammaproteobacteria bacterium]